MSEHDEPEFDRPAATRPYFTEPREEERSPALAITIAVAAVVVAAGVFFWLRRGAQPAPPQTTPAVAARPAPREPAAAPAASNLPGLDASDAVVRQIVARVSSHPRLLVWLGNDDLVRRFVAAVIQVAEGTSPARRLRFLRPAEEFRIRRSGGHLLIDPASYRRYDTLVGVFDSLDAEGTAQAMRELHPLFDQAYGEIGNPSSSFDDTLARAFGNLLAVPIPDGAPELVVQGSAYAWKDHRLEERPAAEKHLLRLGPDNARRVQAKLRQLAAAMNLQPL